MKTIALLAFFAMMAPKEYPVQVHFSNLHMTFHVAQLTRDLTDVSGDGEIQVVESGQPMKKFAASFGHCTKPEREKLYEARWKKANQLIVLFPSSDGKGDECTLKLKPLEK